MAIAERQHFLPKRGRCRLHAFRGNLRLEMVEDFTSAEDFNSVLEYVLCMYVNNDFVFIKVDAWMLTEFVFCRILRACAGLGIPLAHLCILS